MALRSALMLLIAGLSTACIVPTGMATTNLTTHLITETPSAKIENPTPEDPTVIGPESFAAGINPLTGQPAPNPEALNRRPIVVKISNAPPLVRPQAGLGAADLVFEHYAEGGLTRFSAIFYGQAPERVGSIRSARLIDYELVPMYKALLAYSGASIGVEDYIAQSEFADRAYKGVLYGLPYWWRDERIAVPHNLFINLAAVWELASRENKNERQLLSGLSFREEPPQGATGEAAKIDIRYRATRVIWTYDDALGRYRRMSDGEGHYDANTQEQVTAANVVVIYANHVVSDIVESEFQGNKSYGFEIQLWFEGDAVLFRDGQVYTGRWVRPTRESALGLRTTDGQLLHLKPGNTFFQVVQLPEQQNPNEEWIRWE